MSPPPHSSPGISPEEYGKWRLEPTAIPDIGSRLELFVDHFLIDKLDGGVPLGLYNCD